jgi:molybdopterin-guanine dinucleotide biosynthesis protein A
MPSFSAVLLAGGKSTRMGSDKALLRVPNSNRVLWQQQLGLLQELKPQEIFWSGPSRPGMPDHVRVIADEIKDAGPLAGISACLNILQSDLLVVLAVDLPQMTFGFLKKLLERCSPSFGIVAQHGNFFEPLAAVYPKSLHVFATDHLRQKRYALQDFVREGMRLGSLQIFPLGDDDIPLFKNLNSPADK